MTEAEAKQRWRPFVRAANKNNEADVSIGGMNRWRGDELLPKGTRCIGSACMAWRDTTYTETIIREPSSADDGVRYEKRSGGYCGLAGKP